MEKTFTVIGIYWDNRQGWAGDFVATDEDHAIKLAQDEVKTTLAAESASEEEEEPEEEADDDEGPLRIIAVLEGAPEILFIASEE